jgi:sulfite reductase (ferredoxin)
MSTTYRTPEGLSDDIARIASLATEYKDGRISTADFKKHHVPMGIYEQRTDGTYMVRIRATGGVMQPDQVIAVIDIAERYNAALLHLTTRQEIQIHGVSLESLAPILTELQAVGLSSKGGGGDTVRNMLVNELSGIDKTEVFDVTPYAQELTYRMIDEADSYGMPRKLKVAFTSNPRTIDHAGINDVGLVAQIRNGRRGFTVYVGGGAGGRATVSWKLFDFMPAADLYSLVKAMKRFFADNGNRENRAQARIRFIFYKNGVEETLSQIRRYFEEEKAKGVKLAVKAPATQRPTYKYVAPRIDIDKEAYKLWQSRYVKAQRQTDYYSVVIPVPLGDFALEQRRVDGLKKLLRFVKRFGRYTFRFTMEQNIRLRNIPKVALPELYTIISEFSDESAVAPVANDIVACTGAGICRLGICLSKGMAGAIREELLKSDLNLDALKGVSIHVTGCPNSCAMQVWADLGFAGRMLRGERSYPGYQIFLAAERGSEAKFGEAVGALSVRRIPAFVSRLLGAFLADGKRRSFNLYLKNEGHDEALRLIEELKDIPSYEENKTYYYDWGVEE